MAVLRGGPRNRDGKYGFALHTLLNCVIDMVMYHFNVFNLSHYTQKRDKKEKL